MPGFSDIIGQDTAIELLRRAAARRTPSHAYLFSGPENVGKASTALAFARALMCEAPTGGDGCGACLSCRKLASGNHPDFRLITVQADASSAANRSRIIIDQIRQNPSKPRVTPPPLIGDVAYHPLMGGWKVYLIDPADLLTDDAGSALLKVLEEPPPYVVIILVTSRPGLVLGTLRSRCWPVSFKLAPRQAIQNLLAQKGVAAPQAKLFAALSEGRTGWAVTGALEHASQIEAARQEIFTLAARLFHSSPQESLRFAEQLRDISTEYFAAEESDDNNDEESAPKTGGAERLLRAALPNVLDLLVCWFRDLLLISQNTEQLIANEDFIGQLRQHSRSFSPARFRGCIVAALETKRQISRFANPTLATEALAIRLQRELS